MSLAERLRPARSRATNILFPPSCPLCRAETGAPDTPCPACWSEIAFLDRGGCRRCGRPIPGAGAAEPALICDDCIRHQPVWERGAAVFAYAGAGRRLILGLKHGDRLDMVPMLGGWALRDGRELIERADLIAPVPLHWSRRLKRRGNQAGELARWLCRSAGKPGAFAPRLLVRHRRTASQDGKNRAERVANLAGALAPGPDGRAADRHVLLIDDVLTTGATLNAAAETCLQAGARAVDILVLALVVRDEFPYIPAPSEDENDEAG